MKEQDKIPTTKVKRAAKLVSTGAKIGGNYVKYYAKKAVGNENARKDLFEDNADDIYESLSELKGSALKMAQIMSMDKGSLPNINRLMTSLSAPSARIICNQPEKCAARSFMRALWPTA